MVSTPWLLLTVFAAASEPAAGWTRIREDDGVLLERQPVPGSAFERLRATLIIDAPVDVVANLLWGDGKVGKDERNVSSRELLLEQPSERISYDTVEAPLISTRDYVMRWLRTTDANGRRILTFQTIDHKERPPRAGVVRLARIEGITVTEPLAGRADACRVVQVIFSDPGGSIPAWAAAQGQRDAITSSMKALRARATPAKR